MALGDFAGAEIIIKLDALDGFLYVTERLGAALRRGQTEFQIGEHTYMVDQRLRYVLEDAIGEQQVPQALEKLRAESLDAAAYLAETDPMLESLADIKKLRERADPKAMSYEGMQPNLSNQTKIRYQARWGELAGCFSQNALPMIY
ncbi:MAG: hypothetical protein U0528_06260 [Anaerolineae bacterium]